MRRPQKIGMDDDGWEKRLATARQLRLPTSFSDSNEEIVCRVIGDDESGSRRQKHSGREEEGYGDASVLEMAVEVTCD